MSRAHKPSSAHPPAAPKQMNDAEVAATMDSEAADSAAASSAQSAAAAAAPAPRRSGRARTRSKRLSDASTAWAPGASHAPASIADDEESKQSDAASASASAPSNKRARTTKHTAAPAAASAAASSSSAVAQSSPMVRILGRDTGAQFALCELLALKQIGRLHQCCCSWHRWINEGAFGSNRLLQFVSRVPLSLRSSVWAPRYVQRLALGLERSFGSNPGPAGCEDGRLDEIALRLLPRLNRLRALQIALRLPDKPIAAPSTLPLTSATLTSLVIDLRSEWSSEQDTFTPSLLRSLGGVPSLTSLRIASDTVHRHFADLDFSILPSLTQLQHLSILPKRVVRCSPAQIDALVACRSLTSLDVGVWGPVDESDEDDELSADDDAQLKAGLIKLIQGRNLNGAARLRKIGLGARMWQSIVTPAVAEVLLALHDLESLEHVVWSCELTSAHWAQLSLFSRLHTIHIGAVSAERKQLSEYDYRASLQLDAPLLALQQCPLLSSVSLTGAAESTPVFLSTEHTVLLAALPRLRSLSLRDVYLESLAPLTSAAALTHLALDNCSGSDGESFSARSSIPHLPLLTSLSIEADDELDYPGTSQFAAVSKAMMKRLPLLRPASFHHQSWSTNLHGRSVFPRNTALTARPPPVLRI